MARVAAGLHRCHAARVTLHEVAGRSIQCGGVMDSATDARNDSGGGGVRNDSGVGGVPNDGGGNDVQIEKDTA